MIPDLDLNRASRVVRTIHQLILTAIAVVPFTVVIFNLSVEKAGAVTGLFVALATGVTKVYNTLWPGAPLDG
jgi:hypothetical protein